MDPALMSSKACYVLSSAYIWSDVRLSGSGQRPRAERMYAVIVQKRKGLFALTFPVISAAYFFFFFFSGSDERHPPPAFRSRPWAGWYFVGSYAVVPISNGG